MEKCLFTSCKVNFNKKCFSGDGNLKALAPFSQSPTPCKASKNWVLFTVTCNKANFNK